MDLDELQEWWISFERWIDGEKRGKRRAVEHDLSPEFTCVGPFEGLFLDDTRCIFSDGLIVRATAQLQPGSRSSGLPSGPRTRPSLFKLDHRSRGHVSFISLHSRRERVLIVEVSRAQSRTSQEALLHLALLEYEDEGYGASRQVSALTGPSMTRTIAIICR